MRTSEQIEIVNNLIEECRRFDLSGIEFLEMLSLEEIIVAYNGIGPESFPHIFREAIDKLAYILRPAALIHDVRFTYGNGTREWFDMANDELKRNGIKIAEKAYGRYNPMRYITKARAHTYFFICKNFGWEHYLRACGQKN